jgi:hypothetical protein
MLVQTTAKKKAREDIDTNNVDDVKEEGNSDGEDGDDEEMAADNVQSGNINGP